MAKNLFEATIMGCQGMRASSKKNARRRRNLEESKKSRQLREAEDTEYEADIEVDETEEELPDDMLDGAVVVVDPDLSVDDLADNLDNLQAILDATADGEVATSDEYIGDDIYACPICGNNFFSETSMEDGDVCPVCGETPEGFILQGAVEASDEEQEEEIEDADSDEDIEVNETEESSDEETDEEEEVTEESRQMNELFGLGKKKDKKGSDNSEVASSKKVSASSVKKGDKLRDPKTKEIFTVSKIQKSPKTKDGKEYDYELTFTDDSGKSKFFTDSVSNKVLVYEACNKESCNEELEYYPETSEEISKFAIDRAVREVGGKKVTDKDGNVGYKADNEEQHEKAMKIIKDYIAGKDKNYAESKRPISRRRRGMKEDIYIDCDRIDHISDAEVTGENEKIYDDEDLALDITDVTEESCCDEGCESEACDKRSCCMRRESSRMRTGTVELDEERLNSMLTKYVTENYKNAKSMQVKSATIRGNALVCECVILFKSGKKSGTTLNFEGFDLNKRAMKLRGTEVGKVICNESKNPFLLEVKMIRGHIVPTTFRYNYVVTKEGKKYQVSGKTLAE